MAKNARDMAEQRDAIEKVKKVDLDPLWQEVQTEVILAKKTYASVAFMVARRLGAKGVRSEI